MNEKRKIKWLVGYLILVSIIFAAQSYYVYFEFIPTILAAYASNDALHTRVERALYTLANFGGFWFVALAGSVVGLIGGAFINVKKKSEKTST
jgi:hypothetical protein